jgi:hypothetical protein
VLAVILFLSYNAFSYDLFNYIFDAKIITHYHQNPYFHKALDYSGDPMLSFMHWTHRTYPYGPSWLILTVPLSFIGLGYFLLTFYLFKLLAAFSFIGSAYLIGKIAKKIKIDPLFAVAAFALNPLVIIESLVSSHNDIEMMFLALLAIYLFLEKKYIGSGIGLLFSIGLKFATVFIIPGLIVKTFFKVSSEVFYYILIASMLIGVAFATLRTDFQPWYLIYILPFAAFVQKKFFVMIPVFIISLFALLQYVPFLYLGNWDPPVPVILNDMLFGSILTSIVVVIVFMLVMRKRGSEL